MCLPISHSSNVGTVTVSRRADKAKLRAYLSSFGLGQRTGIGLPGEATGYLPPPDMADATRDQISFGQGLSVTSLQEASAIAGIVNGGVYNSPTIIKSAKTPDGAAVEIEQKAPRRIISQAASREVVDMMETVVARRSEFHVNGYNWMAKSGTSERIDEKCGCYRGYTASFIGVAPAEDPTLLVYTVIDRPTTKKHSGTYLASPVVEDILTMALPRYGIKPSTRPSAKRPIDWTPR